MDIAKGSLDEIETNKVSLNLDKKTLNLVDDLAELSNANKTIIITALIQKGIGNYLNYLESTWVSLQNDKTVNQEKLRNCLSNLEKVKKKNKVFLDEIEKAN